MKAVEIARTRVALVIHPDNPVRNARLEDVARILTGEIDNEVVLEKLHQLKARPIPRYVHWIIRARAGLKRRMSEAGATRTVVA